MSRITQEPHLPPFKGGDLFLPYLTRLLRDIATQLNQLSEGRLFARYRAVTAAPTTGAWAQGDMVWNSTPAEAGGAGSKYVTLGWICTAGGTPGTWREMRVLTGN